MTIDKNCSHDLSSISILAFVKINGPGIDALIQAHIFDPFFSTNVRSEGTGLGLSVVRGIIDEHNASINVESEPGCGARFVISFPLHQAPTLKQEPTLPANKSDLVILVLQMCIPGKLSGTS